MKEERRNPSSGQGTMRGGYPAVFAECAVSHRLTIEASVGYAAPGCCCGLEVKCLCAANPPYALCPRCHLCCSVRVGTKSVPTLPAYSNHGFTPIDTDGFTLKPGKSMPPHGQLPVEQLPYPQIRVYPCPSVVLLQSERAPWAAWDIASRIRQTRSACRAGHQLRIAESPPSST